MNIEHDKEAKKFFVLIEGEEAHLLYRDLPEGNLDFYSTFVPDSGRGLGVAKKLVDAGVGFAQESKSKILPTCSYVDKYFQKNKELQDLVLK